MIIPINEDWQISTDQYQWKVQKRYTPLTGKQLGQLLWENRTYHTTLDSAIRSLSQSMIRSSDTVTLLGALETFKNVTTTLSHALDRHMDVSA